MAAMVMAGSASAADSTVEFYHHWGAKGELKALEAVADGLEKRGYHLEALKAGDDTEQTLLSRIAEGKPAVAMKMHGQDLVSWSKKHPGALADVGKQKGAAEWKAALPKALHPFMADGNKLHGVPIGMHRANSTWASKAVFDQFGMKPPANWAEFNAIAPKLKEAGIVPLALGGQDWQEGNLFEAVVLGIGGPDFYRAAIVRNEPASLQSDTMLAVFKQMRILSGFVDDNYKGRSWTDTAQMVANGKAAMQIMGEWVKSEFLLAGLQPNKDFLCFPAPGTKGSFQFLSDFIGVFNARDPQAKKASEALVATVMDKSVQEKFSLAKGSIPSRLDVTSKDFDACAQAALADRKEAIRNNRMVGSLTYQHATTDAVKDAMVAVAHAHFESDMPDADAVKMLVEKVAAARKN